MKIEKAKYDDMPIIADFIRSSASWYEPFLNEKDMKEHNVDETWIDKNYKKREFYIGKDEKGEEVGTISMQFFGKKTYLGYIYLDSNKTGKGYGGKLMQFAREESKKRGQDSLILIAHPKATWATKAYEKFGFEKKFEKKEEIHNYSNGILKSYYEEGFHLYTYKLR